MPAGSRVTRRAVAALITSNVLGGVGVAASVAVGALVVERVGGASVAGLGQALSVLGSALAAVPLARLAAARGRRWSLGVGYGLATVGALVVAVGALADTLALLLAGLAVFGCAQATNLQSRYAATDVVDAPRRGRAMSLVVWGTTVGVVVGPNITAPADRVGTAWGLAALSGPFVLSAAAFALAAAVVLALHPGGGGRAAAAQPRHALGALAALRWAAGDRAARTGVVTIAAAHATMVVVMVMTPLHMRHHGMTLELVGLVISAHTFGMYGLSPVFGWLTDRWGAWRTAAGGALVLAASLTLAFGSASADTGPTTGVALLLLGVGWSACTIAGSALIAATPDLERRIGLQGAADATLSYAGAAAAALGGPVYAVGGFRGVSAVGAVTVALVVVALATGRRGAVGVET